MSATSQPLRCLLVEDLEDDAKLILRELRASGYDVTSERVDTPEAMHAALGRAAWDLVISDFSMPQFSGLDALKILHVSGHDLPFILVSGAMGEETAVTAMRAGAHDYLLKHDLARMGPAVKRELTNAADRRARRRAEETAQQSEALIIAAGQMANFGGWRVNLSDNTLFWSDEVARIHEEPPGFSPALAQGINYYAPEWREKITAVFTACARDGTPYDEEMEIITTHGRRVWVRAAGMALRDARGHIYQVQGAFQDISARKHAESIDVFLAQAGVSLEGEPFFPALARFLAHSLKMDYICIDRLEGDALSATTLAVWHDGHFEDNLTYALKDTPCGEVVGKNVCCYPSHVIRAFPHDQALQDLRAESYVGVTLFSHTGHPIGLIAVIGRQPLTDRALAETTLARVVPRAAGELERLMIEADLKASEGKFKALADGSPLAIYVSIGIDQKATYINPTFLRLFGYSFEEVSAVAKWWPLAYPEESYRRQISEEWQRGIEQAIATGSEVEPKEAVVTCKDGSRRNILWGFKTMGKENWAFGLDLTARKRAELDLQLSEERFRVLFEDISTVAIQGYRADGTTQFWNRASEQFYGYTAQEAVGRNLLDLIIPAELRSGVVEAMRLMAEKGTSIPSGELTLRRKDGSRIEVYSNHAIVQPPNRPAELFCMDVDLTALKRTEQILQRQTEELRQRNEALTRFNEAAVGRELRMVELKREINELCERLGEPPRHGIPAIKESLR